MKSIINLEGHQKCMINPRLKVLVNCTVREFQYLNADYHFYLLNNNNECFKYLK
jgi:hypothetical protein